MMFIDCAIPMQAYQGQTVSANIAEVISTKMYQVINNYTQQFQDYDPYEQAFMKYLSGRAKLMKIQYFRNISWILKYKLKDKHIL